MCYWPRARLRGLKMARYWPSCFLCFNGLTWSCGKKKMEKRMWPISSRHDWKNLANRGFIINGKKRPFSCGTNTENPKGARWAHLAHSGSLSECKIRFILPTCWFGLIIKESCLISWHFYFQEVHITVLIYSTLFSCLQLFWILPLFSCFSICTELYQLHFHPW